ncbi:MAG: 50S ribosomal protein L13 [Candidatus Nanoarchaeia archaeon]|nr:50S ribosomal protein L13 [Candidatus Nanoarchaeia archaeon]
MKIIDGTDATLGRLASYAAKEALKGEEITILNCEKVLVTGNKNNFILGIVAKRGRVGTTQKGPKYSRSIDKIVKRTIRGMLPNARRSGRGSDAHKRIKCYIGIPKEFENAKIEKLEKRNETISHRLGDIIG